MKYDLANPNPRALVESLRSVGYSLPTALADIIDNSVAAGADSVWVDLNWHGRDSTVFVLDDGSGMCESRLIEAMRAGATSPTELRGPTDLGRFGLGLKTASFSQCRRLTVWSKVKGGAIAGRRWDLDYIVAHNEWRLQRDPRESERKATDALDGLDQGTLVIWETLDRVVGGENASADEPQKHFLMQIDETRRYLEMIFHRLLLGSTRHRRNPISISVNGNKLKGWDPFHVSDAVPPECSPVEEIPFHGQVVRVRGYVMPHKDRLSDSEYQYGAGPKGWLAQQGYYIYRNDRMLISGDWLQLGRTRAWTKEEQYKLARLSIDIDNSMDLEWALDVKKCTARPPPSLRGRLTGLAERQRSRAKEAFVYRGTYGPRPTSPTVLVERPWLTSTRADRTVYRINRKYPLIQGVLERLGPLSSEVDAVLRLVEETVPVERIWVDVAESLHDHAIPYEGLESAQVAKDMATTYRFLRERHLDKETAIASLAGCEPFNRYPELIATLGNEEDA